MHVPLWIWAITMAVIAGFFVFDFFSHVRSPHAPSMKEAGAWAAFYMGMAVVFGGIVWITWDGEHAMQFYTGWITELALSVDNLFVFTLIMAAFKIPRKFQQKVLLIGIVLALLFRLIFILLGAALIAAWSDVFYIFAVFLIYTAVKLIIDEVRGAEETNPNDMMVIKWLRKVVHVTPRYHGDNLTYREKSGAKAGKFALTPLFVALIAIGLIDVMFAFDSIPAIYGITSEPFLVFTTNAFALMGLRQMFFLIDGLLERLVYLAYGLGIILLFIGVKLLFHALHENNLPFINSGEDVHSIPEISTLGSLVVIVGVLATTVVLSLIKSKRDVANGGQRATSNRLDWDEEGNKIVRDKNGKFLRQATEADTAKR
ncbi:tellurium resistance protein TerC [Corynebacterium phocae]|uniref:Tellurium resistance protein TerC n=1 Tax=Corynebacterium phocae TaxID=161895 RepID=A0A1L7D2N5_9CORY|nr:TerC family protein [Corynebacterium phocae]APT92355.1 tellurium resistance protein TerC [Corynebacterium phocae]KAA8724947.1 TerC family protein [Corynebacterium phocae]